jgi:hypothetical protein
MNDPPPRVEASPPTEPAGPSRPPARRSGSSEPVRSRRAARLAARRADRAGYERSWLAKDLTAGLVLTALLVPAGMGYAEAAGLPAILGLYATIVPLLAYALLGPSRILVLGPDSSLVPLIAAAVVPLAAGDPDRTIELAALLAVHRRHHRGRRDRHFGFDLLEPGAPGPQQDRSHRARRPAGQGVRLQRRGDTWSRRSCRG